MATKTLAVIVGAGSGTGKALGAAFAQLHSVALLARNAQSLQSITESIQSEKGVGEVCLHFKLLARMLC